MKLIDVLDMIAKGKLERGTVIEWGEFTYTYINIGFVRENDNAGFVSIWCDINEENLNDEVEIIGKDTNAATKIEEIDTEFLRYTFEYGCKFRPVKAITSLGDKLNEVIRELNRRSE